MKMFTLSFLLSKVLAFMPMLASPESKQTDVGKTIMRHAHRAKEHLPTMPASEAYLLGSFQATVIAEAAAANDELAIKQIRAAYADLRECLNRAATTAPDCAARNAFQLSHDLLESRMHHLVG